MTEKLRLANPATEISTASIAARLERLPLSGFHRRFITLISLGGWFDFYDIFMMAYLGAALQQSQTLTLQQFSHVIFTLRQIVSQDWKTIPGKRLLKAALRFDRTSIFDVVINHDKCAVGSPPCYYIPNCP